jgi:DNA-binding transcriptional LysR family regulator
MHLVRYFLALCETLNFSRAAGTCNVSQPDLTRAVRKLEEEPGGLLLRREHLLTHLTDFGRLVRPHLEQMMAEAEAAKSTATGGAAACLGGRAPTVTSSSAEATGLPQGPVAYARIPFARRIRPA